MAEPLKSDPFRLISKGEARAEVVAAGYTEHFETGESGDFGHGSRLYFRKPGAALNAHGWPLELATISQVLRGQWAISVFGAGK